ncbi:MAG: eukaryotic-like serine/threonine-protein kinase [Solirubrobacterales bacterium]|jgi:serine/threonine-protein kinase|nr:eukaryotic-like serine/threonine-protein kinase [Solirubrobacterales bacterium]
MIGTLLSGRYRLESKLGSGGMSTVYLAEDETLDRPVAVKVLHREISDEPDQLERFRLEARSAAKLSHPNLVTVIDAGEDDGTPYIVFEYVDGETLKQLIQRDGPLGVDEAVAYAIEIGRGLQAAHARRLVHRDIKPQNVLIDTEGRAKVADFGIARSLEQHGITAAGRVLGTTDYVSPEQAMGEDVDERSDVYSLGIVLYEMLTGDVPFQAETQVGVAMKHINDPMPDVQELRPEVSAAVAGVVDRATSKDVDQRYWSVADMVDDLEATLEVEAARGGGTTGQATAVLDSVPRKRRTLAPGRASGAGIVMGLLGVALIVAALIVGEKQLSTHSASSSVKIASAAEFDPGGDGKETGSQDLAIDGNPTGSAWASEHYASADFGGLKTPGEQGVGLVLHTASPVTAKSIDVRTEESGWDAEAYASSDSSPPADLAGWGSPLGHVSGGGTHETIPVKAGPSRWFLLWFTKLPQAKDSPSQFQIDVSDVRILR